MLLKIGIITFHRAINYGAVLQTYALSKYLRELGYDVQVLDYRCKAIEDSYKVNVSFNMYSLKRLFLSPLSLNKKRKFYRFLNNKIPHTKSLYTYNDLCEAVKDFDFIITGSDQVWNSQWTHGDEAYLLNFCNDEKKLSYAASIGKNNISDKEKELFEKHLQKFKGISVREQTGKDLLSSFVQSEISLNCDPVALLDKDLWTKITNHPKQKNYVLVYMLVNSKSLMNAAIEYGKKTGKEVILINDNIRKNYPVTYKRNVSPEEFVGLFCDADCVFTNSFHGTMFSIIFEKELHIELQKYSGAPNSRFTDLLKKLEIENCIFDTLVSDDCINKIDYVSVKEKIKEMQNNSYKYFLNAFKL